jgi:hypothetical protein
MTSAEGEGSPSGIRFGLGGLESLGSVALRLASDAFAQPCGSVTGREPRALGGALPDRDRPHLSACGLLGQI